GDGPVWPRLPWLDGSYFELGLGSLAECRGRCQNRNGEKACGVHSWHLTGRLGLRTTGYRRTPIFSGRTHYLFDESLHKLLVLRSFLGVSDHQDLDWASRRFQFQPELFLKRGEQRRGAGLRNDRS